MNKAQQEADKLRHEAKTLMRRMFGIAEGESNGTVERLVDCIISTAILEIASMNHEAAKDASLNRATSENA